MTMNNTPVFTRLYKAPDAFGISVSTLRRWIDNGSIKPTKRGSMVFVRTNDVIEHIEGEGD